MVFGGIQKVIVYSVVGLLAASFFKDAFASGLGKTIGDVGQGGQAIGGALTSIGGGTLDFLEGIGTGAAKLLNPLFTLKELAGPVMAVGAQVDQAINQPSNQTASFSESGAQEVASGTTKQSVTKILFSPKERKQITSSGFIGPIPTTSQLAGAGYQTATRPLTLSQFAQGQSTTFALPPALEGLRSRFG